MSLLLFEENDVAFLGYCAEVGVDVGCCLVEEVVLPCSAFWILL